MDALPSDTLEWYCVEKTYWLNNGVYAKQAVVTFQTSGQTETFFHS